MSRNQRGIESGPQGPSRSSVPLPKSRAPRPDGLPPLVLVIIVLAMLAMLALSTMVRAAEPSPPPSLTAELAAALAALEQEGRFPFAANVPPMTAERRARLAVLDAERQRYAASRRGESGAVLRIVVREPGMVRLTSAELANGFGLPVATVEALIARGGLALSQGGEPVAWLAESAGDGLLFYGEALDSRWSADNVYKLRRGPGLLMERRDGGRPDAAQGALHFPHAETYEDNLFAPTAVIDDPDVDYWFWDFVFSADTTYETATFTIMVPEVAAAGEAALAVRVHAVRETGSGSHDLAVRLNGVPLGSEAWQGTGAHTAVIPFDQVHLQEGANRVELTATIAGAMPFDLIYINGLELTYQRSYLVQGPALVFNSADHRVVTLDGLTTPRPRIFELADPRRPRLVARTRVEAAAAGTYRASFRPASPFTRHLMVTEAAIQPPVEIAVDRPSDLLATSSEVDHLIIAPGWLTGAARGLAAHRQGQGLRSLVVDLEDVYDEIDHGIASPQALRAFLLYTQEQWRSGPRYVVLVGEGSFDYRDYLGHGGNLIPPLMVSTRHGLFASESRLADADPVDGLPEMTVGRLPVLTTGELRGVIDKMITYEAAHQRQRVMMVADNADAAGNFPAEIDRLTDFLSADTLVERIVVGEAPLAGTRAQLLAALGEGALLMNYVGHGGIDRLAQEGLLTVDDVLSLGPSPMPPILAAMTCSINHFEVPGILSLGAALVAQPAGGAVAVWAPTGLSTQIEAAALHESFLRLVFRGGEHVLGDAIQESLRRAIAQGQLDLILDVFLLMGDPALRIR